MKSESRTHIFGEIFLLVLMVAYLMDKGSLLRSTFGTDQIIVAHILLSVLLIFNCIRFWRRPKDTSVIEGYPIMSNFFVSVSIFSGAMIVVGYTVINVYARYVIEKV